MSQLFSQVSLVRSTDSPKQYCYYHYIAAVVADDEIGFIYIRESIGHREVAREEKTATAGHEALSAVGANRAPRALWVPTSSCNMKGANHNIYIYIYIYCLLDASAPMKRLFIWGHHTFIHTRNPDKSAPAKDQTRKFRVPRTGCVGNRHTIIIWQFAASRRGEKGLQYSLDQNARHGP